MDAMILAAGLGTRLRPLTYAVPKALIDVGGAPALERVARRLVEAGATRIVVNVSPHAERIRDYIRERRGWGVDVRISMEAGGPLGTGGGLSRAAPLFRGDRPILVHNVDILTDLDLRALYDAHDAAALATLAVRTAVSDRYLVFDNLGFLGLAYGGEETRVRMPDGPERRRDYLGISVVAARLPSLLVERGRFSIFGSYLRLVAAGERVDGFDAEVARWRDIGTFEDLARARREWG